MSANLFDWNFRETWLDEVAEYAGALLTSRVQAKIARARPECWSDDFAWLPIVDGEHRFAAAFADYYRHVRAFHGCRPSDLGCYFTEGIRGQAAEAIEAQFHALFRDVPETVLRKAITELQERKASERGRFWVVLDENELVEHCGHYLIQGSEYLMSLAATLYRLSPGEDYRLRLRSIGTPTVFELNIPVEQLPEPQVSSLARLVLGAWGERIARRPLGMRHSPCLTVMRTIDANHLVSHVHPRRIRDPHFGRTTYLNEITECPYCVR